MIVAKAAGLDLSISQEIDTVEHMLEATDRLNERYAQAARSQDS